MEFNESPSLGACRATHIVQYLLGGRVAVYESVMKGWNLMNLRLSEPVERRMLANIS